MLLLTLLSCVSAAPTPAEVAQSEPVVAAPAVEGARAIGAYPFCEPSALLPLDDGRILVADNEGRPADPKDGEDARPTLWVSTIEGPPTPVPRVEAKQDVEALARVGETLWVVGSLSRNKRCEVRPKRWEVHVHPVHAWTSDGLGLGPARVLERKKGDIAQIEGSAEACRQMLFSGIPEAAPVCAAIVAAAAKPAGQACDAMNVEGAVTVGDRVWVGLRAPLVAGRAVLARIDPEPSALTFDAVRTVDLGGLGIRELVADGDRLYGIAGTVLDATGDERSQLFSVPLAGLETGDLPVTVHDADLPPSAESFLLRPSEIVYLIDGAATDGRTTCDRAAGVVTRPR